MRHTALHNHRLENTHLFATDKGDKPAGLPAGVFKANRCTAALLGVLGMVAAGPVAMAQNQAAGEPQVEVLADVQVQTAEGSDSPVVIEGRALPLEAAPHVLLVGNNAMFGESVTLVERPFLGVATEPVNAAMAAQLPVPEGVGLLITHVAEDSPAAKAGLKVHDVLVMVNDQWVINTPQLAVLVRLQPTDGQPVSLTVQRKGESRTLTAHLVSKALPALALSGLQTTRPLGETMPGLVEAQRVTGMALDPMQPHLQVGGPQQLSLRLSENGNRYVLNLGDGEGRLEITGPNGQTVYASDLSEIHELDDALQEKLEEVRLHLKEMQTHNPSFTQPLKTFEQFLNHLNNAKAGGDKPSEATPPHAVEE